MSKDQRMEYLKMSKDPYIDAHVLASKMLKRGEIIAFSCKYESGQGRTITLETDQGWNPEPFYSDLNELPE